MRFWTWLILIFQAALVLALAIGIGTRVIPLGISGEWEWLRIDVPPPFDGLALALVALGAYAALAAIGAKILTSKASHRAEAACVTALAAASIAVQIGIPLGAAPGYDLSKWAAVNYLSGSAGYFKVARQQAVRDPWKFLADYPQWIRNQDSLHIGTHPPGLIAGQCFLMGIMEHNPSLSQWLIDHMPESVDMGFRVFGAKDPQPLSPSDRATLYTTALLTLLACGLTVIPLYMLGRVALPPAEAWVAAVLWPLVPAANLFQPVADTAYPLFSTTALALAAWAVRLLAHSGRAPAILAFGLAFTAGLVMAFGMFFTLAFLPIGLIVALLVSFQPSLVSWRARIALIVAIGLGFVTLLGCGWALIGANPFVIASWNLHHHARFYDEYPRTYRLWLALNPVELAIALGVPSAIWCLLGLFAPRRLPASVWATILVLTLTNLTGRNMGEVARLWMLYMPPLLVGASYGLSRWGLKPAFLAATTLLVGLQTLAFQAMIQVVYPV
jgi:hypothetical protein